MVARFGHWVKAITDPLFHFEENIYYWHKVKHIPFDNTTYDLGTVRTENFERYQTFIVVDNKSRTPEIW